jgi:subtilisin family serine protease
MLTMLAPGVSISAAGETMSGTSQATPFVSAALAVMRGRYPGYNVQQIIEALTSTGKLVSTHCYAAAALILLIDRFAVQSALTPQEVNSEPACA